jgi:hypothetical protein
MKPGDPLPGTLICRRPGQVNGDLARRGQGMRPGATAAAGPGVPPG